MTGHPVPATAPRDVRLTYGYATDRGLRRELNEDSLVASEPIFAVADGMGGHEAGEIASGICVRTLGNSPIIGRHLPEFSAADLEELIEDADREIRRQAGGQAGTTLTGVVLVQEAGTPSWLFFNVGDSRTYRLSRGRFGQISVDHSEVQELVDVGTISPEEARTHPRRHVVTRALGTGDDAEADFWLMPVEEGDRILICSDGLSGEVTDDDIYTVLSTVRDPQQACEQLIEATLRSGARDNVTLIIVDATGVADDAGRQTTAPRGGTFAADIGHAVETGTHPASSGGASSGGASSGGASSGGPTSVSPTSVSPTPNGPTPNGGPMPAGAHAVRLTDHADGPSGRRPARDQP